MKVKITFMGIIGFITALIITACGSRASTNGTPPVVSFSKVGVPIISTEVTTIYAQVHNIFVSINTSNPESTGVVPYLVIPDNANSTTQYTPQSLTYNIESYFQFGNIMVNDVGLIYLPVAESGGTGYSLLSYRNNTFESAANYSIAAWIRPIIFGTFDNANLYIDLDNGSGNNSDLGAIPLIGGRASIYSGLFPTWYNGEYVVNNGTLYYSNNNAAYATIISSAKSTQVGISFDQIPNGINAIPGMLDLYQGNIYMGATYSKGQNSYLAVCKISTTAISTSAWSCSYDPNTLMVNAQNITSFRVGQSSGNIIVSVNNYITATTQLYLLNSSSVTK